MSWPLVKLGEIVSNEDSKRVPLKQSDRLNRSGVFPYYGASGIIDYVDDYLFDGNYMLVGEDGANLLARSTPIAFQARGKFWVNNHAHVLSSNGKADLRFLGYYLNKIDLKPFVTGSAQPKLNRSRLDSILVPFPLLTEQKRIAAILDKADAIRRKRQQAIQLADEFLRAVFLDMFGDPVTNPKGWEVKPLEYGIKSISSGWSAKGESYPCKIGELGVLKISSVTSGKFKPEENKLVHSEEIPEGKSLIFPKKGDLLFSRANTRELVAATCIVPNNADSVFLPDKLWKVETNSKNLVPEFLNYLIWQPRFKERLTSQATGTSGSMLNISKGKFESTEAIFPPLDLQENFKSIYWKLQTTVDYSEESLLKGAEVFESLSQKAFMGQI